MLGDRVLNLQIESHFEIVRKPFSQRLDADKAKDFSIRTLLFENQAIFASFFSIAKCTVCNRHGAIIILQSSSGNHRQYYHRHHYHCPSYDRNGMTAVLSGHAVRLI